MMMGGSIGSVKINQALRDSLPTLLNTFQVVHLCGKGNIDHALDSLVGYRQYEFIGDELKDLFAMTDMMLSRAGSNAINEFLFLNIPSLLIPLSRAASRGDQILNANAFEAKGFSKVLEEEVMTKETLTESLMELYENIEEYRNNIGMAEANHGSRNVFDVLKSYLDIQ